MEKREEAADLYDVLNWIGWDRLMFSSGYPHWDYDDPTIALSFKMTEGQRAGIMRDNAKALYRLS
jgi:hypothetical protein